MELAFRASVIILAFLLTALVTLALHEAAHVIMARVLGVRVKRVGVNWRGPFIVREPGEPRSNLYISLAGPLINVIVATLFWTTAPLFAQLNLVLGLSNLLPIAGSDGFRAWAALRELRSRSRTITGVKAGRTAQARP